MDHLLSCNGKILRIFQRTETKATVIETQVLKFCSKNKQFLKQDTFHRSFNQQREIIKTDTVFEVLTECYIPILVTKRKENSRNKFKYEVFSINLNKKCFLLLQQFDSSTNLSPSEFLLCDGPVIFISIENGMQVISLRCIRDVDSSYFKHPKDLIYFGYCASVDNVIVISYSETLSSSKSNSKLLKTYILDLDQATLSPCSNLILPRDIHNLEKILPYSSDDTRNHGSNVQNFCCIGVTTEGHIVQLCDDKVKCIIDSKMKKKDEELHLYYWNCYGLERNNVAVRRGEYMHVIDIKESRISSTLSDVQQILVDDFLQCGSEQLLVTLNEFNTDAQWTLSDFGILKHDGVMMPTTAETDTKSKQSVESAISALHTRLQNEIVFLNEKKREVKIERMEYLRETWQRLQCTANKLPAPSVSSSSILVPLLENKTEWQHNSPLCEVIEVKVNPVLEGVPWQRIIGEQWVVGVTLNNVTNSSLFSPSLTLIPSFTDSSIQHFFISSSQFTINPMTEHQSPSSPDHSAKKRKQLIKHTANQYELSSLAHCTIVMVSDVPKFGVDSEANFQVHIQWRYEDKNDQFVRSLNCGILTLTAKDVLCGRYYVNVTENSTPAASIKSDRDKQDVDHDLEALTSVQTSTRLSIRSAWSDLGMTSRWLTTRSGFFFHQLYQCYVTAELPPLKGVRITDFLYIRSDKAFVTVHTSTSGQLPMLIHHLYLNFPDDIVILTVQDSNIALHQKEAVSSLSNELSFMTTYDDRHRRGDGKNDVIYLKEEDNNGKINVENVRENLAKRKRSWDTVNTDAMLKSIQEERTKLESISDRSILKLQHKTDTLI